MNALTKTETGAPLPPPKGHSMTDAQLGHFLISRLQQATPRLTRPSVSLLQGMHYTPSHQTDIRVTLDKARRLVAESLNHDGTSHAV